MYSKYFAIPVRLIDVVLILLAGAAIYIQIDYLRFLPDPFFQPDSPGYFVPALQLIFKGTFSLEPQRTPGYPFFLYLILNTFKSFRAVLLVQHILLLMTGALAGSLYWNCFVKSWRQSVLIVILVALLPRPLIYSHAVLTDNLYAFLFMLCIFFLVLALEHFKLSFWLMSGFIAVLAITVRPAAISLVLGLAFVALCQSFSIKKYAWSLTLLGWLVIGISTVCFLNYKVKNYWGISQRKGEFLLRRCIYLMDFSEPGISLRIKTLLEPPFKKNKDKIQDFGWGDPEAPVPILLKNNFSDEDCKQLSLYLIRHHFFRYSIDLLKDLKTFVFVVSGQPQGIIMPKTDAMAEGLKIFWENTNDLIEGREFLSFRPETGGQYFQGIYDHSLYPYNQKTPFSKAMHLLVYLAFLYPLGGLLFSVLLLKHSSQRAKLLSLMLFIFSHLLYSDMGGGLVSRYVISVEPLYLILFFNGVSFYWKKFLL